MNWNEIADALGGTWAMLSWIAAVVATTAVLAGTTAIALRRSPRGASWFAAQPLRAAARRLGRSDRSRFFLDRADARQLRHVHRAVISEFTSQLREGSDVDANRLVWCLLLAAQPDMLHEPRPYASEEFRAVYELLVAARSPELRGLFLHYQVPELWAHCDARLEACVSYMERFVDVRPVSTSPTTRSFRDLATAYTGAAVLADGCAVQGGVLGSIEVFHRGRWDGPDVDDVESRARRTSTTPYEAFHSLPRPPHEMRARVVGQYDGRVPSLVSVAVVERQAHGGAQVVLVTDETCYVTTEPSEARQGPADDDRACKRLVPEVIDPRMCSFRQLSAGSWTFDRVEQATSRTVLLNVILGLLSTPAGAEPALVFAIRSDSVRNGAGGLAPAAGGVIELSVGRLAKDSDAFGCVDPRLGVVRECREELGIVPDPGTLHPAAVFLSTTRARPLQRDGSEPRVDTGELVASVLYLGSTELGLGQIRESSWRADLVEGAYESRGFVSVPLCESADAFVQTLRRARFTGRDVVFSEPPAPGDLLLDCLGQSGVLTCLYASARVHGPEETLEAFAALEPWWLPDWPDAVPGGRARICRGFDSWLGWEEDEIEALFQAFGHDVGVDDLRDRLRRA